MKLLVNAPSGDQEIIDIGPGGGYFDPERVLWDEREDGPMPSVTPGAMVRDGSRLVVDERMASDIGSAKAAAEHNAEIDAQIAALKVPFTQDQMAFLESITPAGALQAALATKQRLIDDLEAQKR
ncbi:MAG: hypothetical protein ABL951_05670 [Alphaproteobacteria bacterium]